MHQQLSRCWNPAVNERMHSSLSRTSPSRAGHSLFTCLSPLARLNGSRKGRGRVNFFSTSPTKKIIKRASSSSSSTFHIKFPFSRHTLFYYTTRPHLLNLSASLTSYSLSNSRSNSATMSEITHPTIKGKLSPLRALSTPRSIPSLPRASRTEQSGSSKQLVALMFLTELD